VNEATVCRIIRKIEAVIIKSEQFHLLGKKALRESETAIEVVVVKATEQPIECHKKTGITLQW